MAYGLCPKYRHFRRRPVGLRARAAAGTRCWAMKPNSKCEGARAAGSLRLLITTLRRIAGAELTVGHPVKRRTARRSDYWLARLSSMGGRRHCDRSANQTDPESRQGWRQVSVGGDRSRTTQSITDELLLIFDGPRLDWTFLLIRPIFAVRAPNYDPVSALQLAAVSLPKSSETTAHGRSPSLTPASATALR